MPESTQKYILDSNVFIEAHRRYYSFDIAPAFWAFLVNSGNEDKIISIDRVYDEIVNGNDKLAEWIQEDFSFAIKETNTEAEVIGKYGEIMEWANEQTQFTQAAMDEFARVENADPWVIAYASAKNCVVVTQEVFDRTIRKKIPIPNVCIDFDIKFIDTFTLLRELNFQFR